MAALVIESGHVGRDPLADIDRRVSAAIEALPGVVAAIAWLRKPPDQRTVYIAVEAGTGVCSIRRETRSILRENGVSVHPTCVHIAAIESPTAS
ncbi:MAG: hypothetical protein P8174_07775 [Gemmatimonadota bacterium]